MDNVSIKMKNCFGIKKLNQTFDFSTRNIFTIYAINGTMKSSFARAFKCFQDDKIDEIKDKIYDIQGEFELKFDNNEAKLEQVFVINSFDDKYEANISNLLIDKKLSETLQAIYQKRNKLFDKLFLKSNYSFEPKLSKNEKYQILEDVIKKDLKFGSDELLENLYSIKDKQPKENFENITYSTIFDNTIMSKIQTPDFQANIKDYIGFTDAIYQNYDFLSKGKLTLPKLKDVSKALEKSSFFESKNKIILKNCDIEISSKENLSRKIKEIEGKLKDSKEFLAIEKILDSNKGKDLKDLIETNPHIITWLKTEKLNSLKECLWLSYLRSEDIKPLLVDLLNDYTKFYADTQNITDNNTEWKRILDIYKQRFSVPYEMQISNLKNAITGANIPQVEFLFKDGDNQKILKRKDLINLDTLSRGEKRALYLLNIIFDVEQRKKENKETLFIIDDIADSFDYKNKYAIIEYLCEMANQPNFKLIILSHNFDFYRTISSRLGLKKSNRFVATRNRGSIEFANPTCDNNPFENWQQNPSMMTFFALIPLVRNLVEYKTGNNNEDYNILTELLHQKERTNEITVEEIIKIFKEYINTKYIPKDIDKNLSILEGLLSCCDEITGKNKRIEHKLLLAMGIRHKAEMFMLDTLKETIGEATFKEKLSECTKDQTRFLFNLFVEQIEQNKELEKYKNTLEKVNIVTPENIHLNSFMYEPIMDMDIVELKNLYKEVKELKKEVSSGKDEIGK